MEISEALKRFLKLFAQVQKATEDDSPGGKKITLVEMPGFISPLLQTIPAFGELKQIADSVRNLTDEQKEQLIDDFAVEFDIDDDALEAKIERVFAWIVETSDMIFDLKEIEKQVEASSQPGGGPGNPKDDGDE